jgi:hypothetical protein
MKERKPNHIKYLCFILFLFLFFAGNSQSYTFEWVGKTKLKDMMYPGKKYILKQYCQPKADSIAANGKITFASASIEGVKDLELSYLIKDTILLSTELSTSGKENCQMLDNKVREMTGNVAAFISYGKGKTLYQVYVFKKEDIEYILYYDATVNSKKAHVLIVPKR